MEENKNNIPLDDFYDTPEYQIAKNQIYYDLAMFKKILENFYKKVDKKDGTTQMSYEPIHEFMSSIINYVFCILYDHSTKVVNGKLERVKVDTKALKEAYKELTTIILDQVIYHED